MCGLSVSSVMAMFVLSVGRLPAKERNVLVSMHSCLNSDFCWQQLILTCQNQNALLFVQPLFELRALC